MLSQRQLELLTAFVDGELSQRQRQTTLQLLHDSSEARSILQDLQENSHRLRELPRRKLEADFAGQVVAEIAQRGLRPKAAPPASTPWVRWTSYAAAAVILVAVSMGIYIGTRPGGSANESGIAVNPNAAPVQVAEVPLRVTFAELAQASKRAELTRKLQSESAVHLDVAVQDGAGAVEQLQHALADQGIRTIVDGRVQAGLKKGGQGKVEYLVYAENIRADELEKLLRALGAASANKPSTFQSVTVGSLSKEHREKLSGLLGVPASEFEPPIRKGGVNPAARPNLDPALDNGNVQAGSQSDRLAMVMAYEPGQGAGTAETREFLASRRQQRPGTMHVLLVIRQA